MAAGVAFQMIMMGAARRRVVHERARDKRPHRLVRAAGHAAADGDARLPQRLLRTGADAAADQVRHAACGEKSGQRAMPGALRRDHLARAALGIDEQELLGVAKVLVHLTVFIGNGNLHIRLRFLSA